MEGRREEEGDVGGGKRGACLDFIRMWDDGDGGMMEG